MICFRDQSFCTAAGKTCGNTECHRYLTNELREEARRWWGSDSPPVAFGDFRVACDQFQEIVAEKAKDSAP